MRPPEKNGNNLLFIFVNSLEVDVYASGNSTTLCLLFALAAAATIA